MRSCALPPPARDGCPVAWKPVVQISETTARVRAWRESATLPADPRTGRGVWWTSNDRAAEMHPSASSLQAEAATSDYGSVARCTRTGMRRAREKAGATSGRNTRARPPISSHYVPAHRRAVADGRSSLQAPRGSHRRVSRGLDSRAMGDGGSGPRSHPWRRRCLVDERGFRATILAPARPEPRMPITARGDLGSAATLEGPGF